MIEPVKSLKKIVRRTRRKKFVGKNLLEKTCQKNSFKTTEKLVRNAHRKLVRTTYVKNLFGCKVTHRILRPDMMLCGDEVGADTSQKGDGAIGGEKLLCPAGTIPKESAL